MGGAIPHSDGIDVTNRFVLDWAKKRGGRILDYGCGSGRLVEAGRAFGLDIHGTDVFYEGAETRASAACSQFIREIEGGRIPYPDCSFDVITNNQVMEHVTDLDAVLTEIHRVLKPGGQVLSVFPSKDVWREGHIGIPFSHRLPRGSKLRFWYTWALRSLGFGTWKEQAPSARQWAVDKLAWIDQWTVYRSRAAIRSAYARLFTTEHIEISYIVYRLLDRPSGVRSFLARAVTSPVLSGFAVALFRKLAFLVLVSRKR
jgi:SAM-dependent methyltransferase